MNPEGTHWKRVIIHLDGDAFFASCEQAMHPEYRGKPVITGKERGIVAAASYEAKALGIQRGVALWDVKKICPEAIIVPSDYETYSLFSERMFAIMRRYTSTIEEYGIDEGFADITGLARPLGLSYIQIAQAMQTAIHRELGITVSVGMGPSKVLAKLGSKHKKPNSLTVISPGERIGYLAATPVGKLWGVGPRTAAYCHTLHIETALDFASQPLALVTRRFTKPLVELWHELQGESVLPVVTAIKNTYASISKTKTFTASRCRELVYAQLLKNVENACIKTRRYDLASKKIIIFLKQNDFRTSAAEASLTRATAYPQDLARVLHDLFDRIFIPGTDYRATGIVLTDMVLSADVQRALFEPPVTLERLHNVYEAVDELAEKYGKHTVHLAGSEMAHREPAHNSQRSELPERKRTRLRGETTRKHLAIPLLLHELR
ncbi:MAG: DNA polymerase IV [Patescibacteria group bacterium]